MGTHCGMGSIMIMIYRHDLHGRGGVYDDRQGWSLWMLMKLLSAVSWIQFGFS